MNRQFRRCLSELDPNLSRKVLCLATKHIPENGWSSRSVELALEELELPFAIASDFENLKLSLIQAFNTESRNNLSEYAKTLNLNEMRVSEKIQILCQRRLYTLEPIIIYWQEAVKELTSPYNLVSGFSELGKIADEIWHLAGDQSLDVRILTY